MSIYSFDSDIEYFTLAYFENKRIIQKRPAHLSIVERLGGFSRCKDTNNY